MCMKDGKCTKRFPYKFLNDMQTGKDGYPSYHRRSPGRGGHVANVKKRGQEINVDNHFVVPYSPVLCRIFNAHINVEICNSVRSIKYVLKYVHKGSDQAVFCIEGNTVEAMFDEVKMFQTGHYIFTSEALWRIFESPVHDHHLVVTHLDIHLKNGQRIFFDEATAAERPAVLPRTKLLAFFELCQHGDFAKTLLNVAVPRYYTWQQSKKKFQRRKVVKAVYGWNDVKLSDTLGQVYVIHPNNQECFYLKLLLHIVCGPMSFADLKTHNGEVCETFRLACQHRGLLESDEHWDSALTEASASQSPRKIRSLFAIIISQCHVSVPKDLYPRHHENMLKTFSNMHS